MDDLVITFSSVPAGAPFEDDFEVVAPVKKKRSLRAAAEQAKDMEVDEDAEGKTDKENENENEAMRKASSNPSARAVHMTKPK